MGMFTTPTIATIAAARAATILSKERLELEANSSQVADDNCDGCAYCVDPSPFGAITLLEYMRDGAIKKIVEVNETVCKGCGQCVKVCAAGAISGKRKQPHRIKPELCTSCSACRQVCTTDAIVVE